MHVPILAPKTMGIPASKVQMLSSTDFAFLGRHDHGETDRRRRRLDQGREDRCDQNPEEGVLHGLHEF